MQYGNLKFKNHPIWFPLQVQFTIGILFLFSFNNTFGSINFLRNMFSHTTKSMKNFNFSRSLIILSIILLSNLNNSLGQAVSISGVPNTLPDPTAILDIISDTKGLLFPRMTVAQRDAISSPANSLIIYNTTSRCLEIFTDGAWQSFYCSCPVLDPLQSIIGPDPVCSGSTVSFSVPGVTGAATYDWTVSGVAPGSITGNGSTTISFPAPNSNTFTVDVIASNACNNSSSSQTTTVNAYTAVPPTPVFSSTPAGFCEGGSYNYSIVGGLGPNGTGAISYTWTITASGTARATLTANSQEASLGSPVTYTSTATAITLTNIIAAGNITVSVVGNNTCGSSITPVSNVLAVDQFTASNAGPDQTVCSTSATLVGNTPITGGGTWTLVSGSGTITSPTSPSSTVTGLGLGANTFRWTLLNGSCADSQDDIVVTSDQFTSSNAGPDQTVCATSATLAGNTPLTGGGTWTLISGTGTITTPTSPTSTVTALGLGANTFRWTLLNGVCTDSQDDVVITSDQFTTSNAGPDQTLCGNSATLAGNTPITGGGTWTLVSGTGTITTPTSPTSTVTGLGLGNNTFRWTLLNGVCADSQDDVVITSDQFTTANAGPDQSLCGTSATLAGNTPATGVGTWSLVSGSGTVTSPGSPSSTVTGLGVGANTFRWTLLNGSCSDSQDDVVITTDQFTTANAGTDQSVCGTSATLAGNAPLTGGGTWTLISGTGTITTPSSPTSTVTGLGFGNNTFRWTLLNGSCTDSQDDVIITRDDLTTANAGSDQTLCSTSATLSGNAPLTGVGTWTLVSGTGTVTNPNLPGSIVTGLGAGANTFRWTLLNGSCADSQDDVIITSHQNTTSDAGSDQTVCATTATLGGNAPLTGVGTWTLVSGAGTISSPNSPISGITGLGLGNNTFRWTLLNGSCADSQDDVVITSDQPTTSNAGSDQTLCATSATLAGNTPVTGGGTWTLISGTGTITTPTSPTSGITALGIGPNVFRWTLLNGVCSDSQDDVTITGEQATTAAAGIDQTICANSATLAGNTPVTGNGTWTLISGSGTITVPTSPTSSVTSLGLGANQFRWTLPNGSCTDSQDDVIITSHQFTASAAGSDQTLCATSATLAGNTPATGVGTWTLVSGSGSITTPSSPSSGVTGLGVGANTFRWTLPNGVCTDSQDDVVITSDQFTTSNAGPDQTVCTTTATLAGNTPATGSGTWTLVGGSGSITTPSSPSSGVTGLGVGANTFRWTLPNGNCTVSTNDVVITRNVPSTDPTSITGTLNIASGSTTTLNINGGTAGTNGTVEWYTGSCGGTPVHTGASYTTPSLTSDTQYWVRYEDDCGESNCVTATVEVSTGCTHTFVMADSYGDGWSGSSVDINVNGTEVVSNASISGASGSVTFTASDGDAITLSGWVTGSWTGEVSWALVNELGVVIASGGHGVTPSGVTGGCIPACACAHNFNMFDSYGDGWQGSSVEISINGTGQGRSTLPTGASGTSIFYACPGDAITLGSWIAGSWTGEVSWNITDGTGTVLDSGNYGDTASVTGACP